MRLADDAVDAAADEQRAALDVHQPDGEAQQQHAEDEPRGGRADHLLDDAADVVGGAGQVAQHDRGGAPVADEREHHAADDDDPGPLARRERSVPEESAAVGEGTCEPGPEDGLLIKGRIQSRRRRGEARPAAGGRAWDLTFRAILEGDRRHQYEGGL